MCTNNTCNPEVDCPNEDESTSGSNCTSGSGSNCTSGSGSNCSSGSSCSGSCNGSCNGSCCDCCDCCDGTCNSTVPVQSVTVSPSAVTVKIGRWCHDLSAEVTPAEANQHVCWSSSDGSVASVNPETGYVYGMGEGTAVITATSCEDSGISDSCSVTVEPVLVESITLSDSMVEIGKETTYNICATVCPEDADNKSLHWYSYDESIATVSQDGVITGKSAGRTTICVAALDGSAVIAECAVKVIVPVTSVVIGRPDFTVVVGAEPVLVATVEPDDASDKSLYWSSDNETVATVQPAEDPRHGIVTTKTAGVVNITATSKSDSRITDSCQIAVLPKVSAVVVTPATVSLPKGQTVTLDKTVVPDEAYNKTVVWYSEFPAIASVESNTGKVTALSEGTTKIYAAAQDGSGVTGYCTVLVQAPIKVQSVEVTPYNLIMGVGGMVTLNETVQPDEAYNKTVVWYSEFPAIASVESNTGKVTALVEGTTKIYAAAQDGSGVSGECVVTVIPEKIIMAVNGVTGLIVGENPYYPPVNWRSEDESIAQVDPETGTITAQSFGTTTIRAVAAQAGTVVQASCSVEVMFAAYDKPRARDYHPFATLEQALAHFAHLYYDASLKFNREFGALLYSKDMAGKGMYGFSHGVQGDEHGVGLWNGTATETIKNDEAGTICGAIHTHPTYNYFNDNDRTAAETNEMPVYIVAMEDAYYQERDGEDQASIPVDYKCKVLRYHKQDNLWVEDTPMRNLTTKCWELDELDDLNTWG